MVDKSHIVSRAPIKANWFENQRWYEAMTVWGNGTSITGSLNQTCQCLESQQIICRMIAGLLWITIVLWSGLLYQLFSSGDVNWWISIWVTKWVVFHGNPYIISYMFLLGLGHRESKKTPTEATEDWSYHCWLQWISPLHIVMLHKYVK